MKRYTAIFDTEKMSNVGYSFKAEDTAQAIEFANWKFTKEVRNFRIRDDRTGETVYTR